MPDVLDPAQGFHGMTYSLISYFTYKGLPLHRYGELAWWAHSVCVLLLYLEVWNILHAILRVFN